MFSHLVTLRNEASLYWFFFLSKPFLLFITISSLKKFHKISIWWWDWVKSDLLTTYVWHNKNNNLCYWLHGPCLLTTYVGNSFHALSHLDHMIPLYGYSHVIDNKNETQNGQVCLRPYNQVVALEFKTRLSPNCEFLKVCLPAITKSHIWPRNVSRHTEPQVITWAIHNSFAKL